MSSFRLNLWPNVLRLEHIFRAIDDSGDGIITEVARKFL